MNDHGRDDSLIEPSSAIARNEDVLGEIENAIASIGDRYVADLRGLSESFFRLYETRLEDKDREIASLERRLAELEDEHAAILGQSDQARLAGERYLAELRAAASKLAMDLEQPESEPR